MTHLGDITKINGAEIEPVDVITGGSPCQDLSVAGKRAGLAGERSGLYMDQIRIIKEMREHDRSSGRTGELVRPRYMVWENVPGAFSSNGGKDFGAVLEEAIRVSEPEAPAVPVPDGGWPVAGCLYASDGSWSVAWRQHDAQYWGTPQRRKRIALVADFGGSTAAEILFERKGVSGNPEPCGAAGKGSSGDSESGAGSASYCIQGNCIDRSDTAGCNGKGWTENVSYTLNTIDRPAVMNAAAFSAGQGAKAGGIGYQEECSPSLKASPSGTNTTPTVLINGEADGGSNTSGAKIIEPISFVNRGHAINDGNSEVLRSNCHSDVPCVVEPVVLESNQNHARATQDGLSPTLPASMGMGGGYVPMVTEPRVLDMTHADEVIRDCGNISPTLQSRMGTGGNQIPLTYQEVTGALCANSHPGSYTGQDAYNDMLVAGQENMKASSIVRRLTPMECERLQGFPDGWTTEVVAEYLMDNGVRVPVQCRECIFADEEADAIVSGNKYCTINKKFKRDDFFCARGERRRTMAELRSCPVCGGKNIAIKNGKYAWWVECEECGTEGATKLKRAAAIEAWNREGRQ